MICYFISFVTIKILIHFYDFLINIFLFERIVISLRAGSVSVFAHCCISNKGHHAWHVTGFNDHLVNGR